MTCVIDINAAGRSRRQLIAGLALFAGAAGAAGLLGAPTKGLAGPSIDPKSVAYQLTPKGAARCDNCRQWQAPNACKVVSGPIQAAGWCSIYAQKT
jgi:hypothetical protein